jgi:hypothetical protein
MDLDGQFEAKLLAFRNEQAALESAKASFESELRIKYEKMKERYYKSYGESEYRLTYLRYETELVTHKKNLEEYEKELYSNFQKVLVKYARKFRY